MQTADLVDDHRRSVDRHYRPSEFREEERIASGAAREIERLSRRQQPRRLDEDGCRVRRAELAGSITLIPAIDGVHSTTIRVCRSREQCATRGNHSLEAEVDPC